MKEPLQTDTWTRSGFSLIWDADSIASICTADHMLTVRQFFQLHEHGWADVDSGMPNDHALLIAGIEGCIDALDPDDAARWLSEQLYPAILSYQREIADGGSQAALILWLPNADRLQYVNGDDTYEWRCGPAYGHRRIPILQYLLDGAYRDCQRIEVQTATGNPKTIGLFQQRIS